MKYELINPVDAKLSAIEQVLVNRGIQQQDIPHYLHVSKEDNLSPTLFKNIDEAVQILAKHIKDPDAHIHVVVDPDCDGFTASACLLNYIHLAFPSALSKFSYNFHDDKSHGIEIQKIPDGTTLVVAPDSSSNEYDIHKTLKERGIDVVVLDHHNADKISEYACVVNNQLCDYPNKALSGVGIVYKLCERFDELMSTDYASSLVDLVMLGNVGDMMDLRSYETKYLVNQGIAHLRNPFIKGMAEHNAYSIGKQLTPIGVAFYIVPLVNAITRMGTQDEKELLFRSMLNWEAFNLVPSTKRGCKGQTETIVEQAVRTCVNVKNRQTRAQDTAVETLEELIAAGGLLEHKILMFTLDDSFSIPAEIRGLIANKFMAKYQRPVLMLSVTTHEGKPAFMGSARGYEKSSLTDFRSFCRDSGLVFQSEGHANAFGFGIYAENVDAFLAWSDEALKDVEFSPSYKVDFIYSASSMNPQDILDIGSMKSLWGQNVNEALVAVERVNVTKNMVTLMAKGKPSQALKIELPNGVACIKFRVSEEEYETLLADTGCVVLNIVGKCEVNEYYNSVTPQIIIEDYEIVDRMNYYF